MLSLFESAGYSLKQHGLEFVGQSEKTGKANQRLSHCILQGVKAIFHFPFFLDHPSFLP